MCLQEPLFLAAQDLSLAAIIFSVSLLSKKGTRINSFPRGNTFGLFHSCPGVSLQQKHVMVRQKGKSYWFSRRLKLFSFGECIPLCDVPSLGWLKKSLTTACVNAGTSCKEVVQLSAGIPSPSSKLCASFLKLLWTSCILCSDTLPSGSTSILSCPRILYRHKQKRTVSNSRKHSAN